MSKFLFTFIISFFLFVPKLFSQDIELKLPLKVASYTLYSGDISFLWEDTIGSSWTIDLSADSLFTNSLSLSSLENQFTLAVNTLSYQKYYWRIRSNIDTSNFRAFTVFDLNSIGNLSYHLNADVGPIINANSKVNSWTNLTDTLYNANQSTENLKPEIATNLVMQKDFVKFGGNTGSTQTRLLLNEFLITDTNFTLISCSKQISLNSALSYMLGAASPATGVFSGGTNSGGYNFGLVSSNSAAIRVTGTTSLNFEVRTGFYSKLFINTNPQTVLKSGGVVSQLRFNTIGLRPDVTTFNFYGYIGDILIFNNILTDTNRLLVENYLITKYTPYPDLGKDSIVCDNKYKIGFRKDHAYSQRTWSNGQTNVDSITVTTSGKYWVTVKSFGITLSDTIWVNLSTIPTISQNADTVLCANQNLVLSYTSTGPFVYTWSNGSTADTLFNVPSGEYFISQNDTFKNCILNSKKINVLIDSFSLKTTLGPDKSFCLGSELTFFSSQQNNEPYRNIDWSTGDTTKTIILNTAGDFDHFIEVEDVYGCFFKDTVSLHVNNITTPIVSFVSDTVCFGLPSTLISTSAANGVDLINNYTWSFPDSSSISGTSSANYTHSAPLTFNVMLTVTTDSSCENSISLPVYLHRLPNPNFNNVIACAGNSKLFNNTSVVFAPDSVSSYSWFLNQTFESNLKNPTISLNNEGISSLKLIVNSKFGCIDSVTKQVEVFPALTADFSFKNNCVGDSVIFTDQTASFSVIDWKWAFNGFVGSSFQNPKRVFNAVSAQLVKLDIENAIGCKSSITKTVNVLAQPIASFGFDKICIEDFSLFYDNSTLINDTIYSMNWQIDTSFYTNDSVQHKINTLNSFLAKLSIETVNGCKDDTTATLNVNPKPVPDFDFSPNYGTAPLEVNFQNLTPNATLYSWNFGDGAGVSSDKNPVYTYMQNGIYNITLSATNQFNCNASSTQQIAVIPSDLDIELKNLKFNIQENTDNTISINPSLEMKNVGTRPITNADLVLTLNKDNSFVQKWEGNIAIGSATNYVFDGYYLVADLANSKYVCVEAINVNDKTEENFSNNKVCKLLDGLVQISKPYPNPTRSNVFIDIITKEKGNCSVQVFNLLGELILPASDIVLKNGYNKIGIETSRFQSGKYIVVIKYLDENYNQQFVLE